MLKRVRHHRYFPHFFWLAVIILVILLFFLFSEKAHSGIKIIDTHEHIQSLEKAHELKLAMADLGIEKTVLLPSPIETITLNGSKSFTRYQENIDEILKIAETYPESFIPFCTVSPVDSNALEIFKDCHERGGRGLKLYNGHSYYYEIFSTTLDSQLMKPIYAYAERNNLPVLYHVNITKYEKELENILEAFPNLTVSIPHFMVSSINLDKVKNLLDKYPNLYTDISFGNDPFFAAGFRRISKNPQKYIDFMTEYSDRILFGADMVITDIKRKDQEYMETTLKCYSNILEKKKFSCKPVNDFYKKEAEIKREMYEECEPKGGDSCNTKEQKMNSYTRWYKETKILNGLNLSPDILKKIYKENPERWLGANQ